LRRDDLYRLRRVSSLVQIIGRALLSDPTSAILDPMISITLKGLAKFVTATPAKQRKILRDYKYPKEEGQAMAQYYKEARDVVYSFHKNKRPKEWLMTKANEIRTLAAGVGGGSGPRLQNNARAIEQYAQNFSSRKIDILPDLDVSFTADGVRVKINPDLHVSEGGKEKIIKLEFAKDEPPPEVVKVICQAMFDAAVMNGHKYTPAGVLYFDVARGAEHRGARQGARMKDEIDAALKNIASLWPSI
jgi:hypothetical protein